MLTRLLATSSWKCGCLVELSMLLPGRLRPERVLKRYFCLTNNKSGFLQIAYQEKMFDVREVKKCSFNEILISPRMLADHMPNYLDEVTNLLHII